MSDGQKTTNGDRLFALGIIAAFSAAAGALAMNGVHGVLSNDPKDDVKISATVFGSMTDAKFDKLHDALQRAVTDYEAQGPNYEWSQQAAIYIGLNEHEEAGDAIATDMVLDINDRSPHTVIDIVIDGPATKARVKALKQLLADTFTRDYLTDYNDVDAIIRGGKIESAQANNYLGYVSDIQSRTTPSGLRP